MSTEFGIDLDEVRAFLAGKESKRRALIDERFDRAADDFDAIVASIITEVNPRRIYQYGSLLDRKRFTEISDIDIAVEGLNGAESFFRTLGIAIDSTTLPVDLIEIEKVPEDIANRIRTRGRVVYERSDS